VPRYLLEVLDDITLAEGLRRLVAGAADSEAIGSTVHLMQEPCVSLRRIDFPADGTFVSCPVGGGLVRLLALVRPLVVTEGQASEAEAMFSEPDKEDPARRAWLDHVRKNGQ